MPTAPPRFAHRSPTLRPPTRMPTIPRPNFRRSTSTSRICVSVWQPSQSNSMHSLRKDGSACWRSAMSFADGWGNLEVCTSFHRFLFARDRNSGQGRVQPTLHWRRLTTKKYEGSKMITPITPPKERRADWNRPDVQWRCDPTGNSSLCHYAVDKVSWHVI